MADPKALFADNKVVHAGKWSARIERKASSPGNFSSLTYKIPTNFSGHQVALHGFLRTENVSGFAGLWMREDDEAGAAVAFDNMRRQRVHATTPWREYSITLPLDPNAKNLYFEVLTSELGRTWADNH
jgi:hypothetical protein